MRFCWLPAHRVDLWFTVIVLFALLPQSSISIGDHKPGKALGSFSIKPPFFPDTGAAAVPGWEIRGGTLVKENSLILSDTALLPGLMVNRRPFFLSSVEITLELGIFGDEFQSGSIGLWLTHQPIRPGPLIGVYESWTGLSVQLYISSGKETEIRFVQKKPNQAEEIIGSCDGVFWEQNLMQIHLFIEHGNTQIFVDPNHTDDWMRCTTLLQAEMPPRYFFAITGSTDRTGNPIELLKFSVNTMDEPETIKALNQPETLTIEDNLDVKQPPNTQNEKQPAEDNEELRTRIAELQQRNQELLKQKNVLKLEIDEVLYQSADIESKSHGLSVEIRKKQKEIKNQAPPSSNQLAKPCSSIECKNDESFKDLIERTEQFGDRVGGELLELSYRTGVNLKTNFFHELILALDEFQNTVSITQKHISSLVPALTSFSEAPLNRTSVLQRAADEILQLRNTVGKIQHEQRKSQNLFRSQMTKFSRETTEINWMGYVTALLVTNLIIALVLQFKNRPRNSNYFI